MAFNMPSFSFDWILVDELAVGPAPRTNDHMQALVNAGIKGILALCSEEEAPPPPPDKKLILKVDRIILPDHNYKRALLSSEILRALSSLKELKKHGPVYIHCKAGIERSPLICIAWLSIDKGLPIQSSLDYVMNAHPGTNPLGAHLMTLESAINEIKITR